MTYYGQHDIDKTIHSKYIKKPVKNGSFLELGAIDGVRFSNTKFFEDHMGFNLGVLIEPVKELYQHLIKNRPKCFCFNKAIHSNLKYVSFLQGDVNAVGCIEDVATDTFKNKWHKNSKTVELPAARLDEILELTNLEYIDFWSLDVEGSEVEALSSMNWDLPIGLICVEMHNSDSKEIDSLIKSQEFDLIDNIGGVNNLYLNKNYHRLDVVIS